MLIKKESKGEIGQDPEERTTETILQYGVVNIDKPKGPTSHQVSEFVQKILNIKKSGHSGSLDPGVTGLLPVALGKSTRIVYFLLTSGKEYVCIMHLHKEVEEKKLREVLKKFTGKIMQMPPIKSAVKRRLREREIYYLEVLEIDGQDVMFKVGCQAGTYIRKLCHDIGQELEVGAHMAELRRTKAGPFDETTKVTLQDLTDAFHYYKEGNDEKLRKMILPPEYAVQNLKKVHILDTTIKALTNGVDLKVPGISKLEEFEKGALIAVMTLKNELVAVGNAKMGSKEIMEKDRGLAVEIQKVFMKVK